MIFRNRLDVVNGGCKRAGAEEHDRWLSSGGAATDQDQY
jgi:hypothetical protein